MKPIRLILVALATVPLLLSSACISNSGTGLTLTSPNFTDGGTLPVNFTCNGENISPELDWSGAPTATKSYTIIMQDLDAPGGVFTHWMLYDMGTSMILIPKRLGPTERVMGGSMQGTNDFGTTGYSGPCPPAGETHRYVFTLYALDTRLNLDPAIGITRLMEVMQSRILEQKSITALYTGPSQ